MNKESASTPETTIICQEVVSSGCTISLLAPRHDCKSGRLVSRHVSCCVVSARATYTSHGCCALSSHRFHVSCRVPFPRRTLSLHTSCHVACRVLLCRAIVCGCSYRVSAHVMSHIVSSLPLSPSLLLPLVQTMSPDRSPAHHSSTHM